MATPNLGMSSALTHAIKTIGDVKLDKFHRAKALISFDNLCDDAFEGTAKLHGVIGGQCNGLAIYFRKTVINNRAWAAFVLGDNTDRRYTQVLEMPDNTIWKDHPSVLAHHVKEFRAEKVLEVKSGLMGTPGNGSVLSATGPRGCFEANGCTPLGILLQCKICGMMCKLAERGQVSTSLA
jgi:hypothetical protein